MGVTFGSALTLLPPPLVDIDIADYLLNEMAALR